MVLMVIVGLGFLILMCLERTLRIAIFSAWFYGFLFGFAMGNNEQPKSFHKLSKFFATLTLITVSMMLLIGVIFYRKTLV